MTEKELEIAVNEHEMQRFKQKEAFGAECIETACAFANAHGGYIVIGVDDQSECAKNGNAFPELSQKYGSFITFYDSRLKQEMGVAGKRSPEGKFESGTSGMNGGIKGGMNGGMKSEGGTINGTINQGNDTINEVLNAPREAVNEVVNAPHEVVNEVVKQVLYAIESKPGIKKPEIETIVGKSHATIERAVDLLKKLSKIEYRGSAKTGGYYAVKQED